MTHPLIARLRDPDPRARREACAEAAHDPSAVLLVESLCGALADVDNSVARAAADALAGIGPQDPELARRLQPSLRGASRSARSWAAFTLARLEPPTLKLLPVLLDGLELEDRQIRWSSAKLLVELGRLETDVLPVLLHFVAGGERPRARRMSVFALRELAPDRPETTQALLAASRCEDLEVRRAALSALAVVFEHTGAASTRLLEALANDPDPASRGLAASALGALARRKAPGSEDAEGALQRAVESDVEPRVQRAARAARSTSSHPSSAGSGRRRAASEQ